MRIYGVQFYQEYRLPMNTPMTAEINNNTHVASGFSKSMYPMYAIMPIVVSMNITPIGALLPVNNPAKPTTNMNIIGTRNKSPIGSIHN